MRSQKLKYIIRNDKGFALVMVLLIAVIVLGMTAGLIYMVITGTQISGIERRHQITLAATGEEGIVTQIIASRNGIINAALDTALNYNSTTPAACATAAVTLPDLSTCADIGNYTGLEAKIKLPTACWSATCDTSLTIDPTNNTTYDFSYDVAGYRTYGKIVDTTLGNTTLGSGGGGGSSSSNRLIITGVVLNDPGQSGGTPTIPYLYTIELHAQSITNPTEKLKLSILYQF
ncbi:MAG: hypothetical protein HZC10_04025 [Nitrospirae bacterium]|nr:hypothetical protein [Nitrospirota bacterium]